MEVYWCVQLERLVYEKNTAAYQIADQEERTTRRAETDVIKEFVEYARAQGSTHADHYYSNYTRLAYKSVGITDKTTAAGSQLDDLALVEHLITHTLRTGMAAGRNYKDIYQDCKNRLEAMRYLQCTAWNVLFVQSTGIKQGENGWKQCKGIFV